MLFIQTPCLPKSETVSASEQWDILFDFTAPKKKKRKEKKRKEKILLLYGSLTLFLKYTLLEARDGSAVNSTGFFSGGPRFSSQHPHGY